MLSTLSLEFVTPCRPSHSFPRKTTTSFPHRREPTPCHSCKDENPSPHYHNARKKYSVIPAKTRIHRPTITRPEKILRHSREGGNPQFPRMREFNENTVQTDQYTSFPRKTTTSFPHRREPTPSVIPAKTRIHRPTITMPEKNTPSFPRRRESTIPAHAGI